MTADEIIKKLDLQPHPEGGYFKETFRDTKTINGRSCGTAIFFLLKEGQGSHWHKVDAAEVWHFYAGSSLELRISDGKSTPQNLILSNQLEIDELPQHVVPAHHWQAARTLGEWTLVGCTVSPGFEFSSFELAPPDWEPG